MNPNKKNILVAGLPGIGKTTLIKQLIYRIRKSGPLGFYTEEIRQEGVRKGFQLVSLEGENRYLLTYCSRATTIWGNTKSM